MRKFESVLAFGDSHVAGCELSDYSLLEDYLTGKITIEEADAVGKTKAFPQIVADHFNVPCYNFAMTGGSNERSLRKLIDAVQQYPNSLVLFGYTCSDRKEFYYPDYGKFLGQDEDKFIQVGLQWEGRITTLPKTIDNPINKIFIDHISRPHNNFNELSFIVDAICTLWSKDFLHLPLFPEHTKQIDNMFNFEGYGNYLNWCDKNKFSRGPFLHYGEDAHKKLAELIIKEIA